MGKISIVTSKGQANLPQGFQSGSARWGEKRFTAYFNPRIFELSFNNNVTPTLVYRNYWRCIFVLYDVVMGERRPGFTEVIPLPVQGNPLPIVVRRVLRELTPQETAFVYGTLRGPDQDHGKVSSWIPRPDTDEPHQLLMVITGGPHF